MTDFATEKSKVSTEATIRVALAKALKCEFTNKDTIFASEVRYGITDRRADFLALNKDSHAYEIKSDSDSLSRLSDQITDYVSTFDFVSVITSKRHLPKVKKIIPDRVGLRLFDEEGQIKQLRDPKRNKRLSKNHLAKGCGRVSLITALEKSRSSDSAPLLQDSATKHLKLTELRGIFLDEMRRRYTQTSEFFLSETDGELDVEDLLLLRRAVRIAT